MVGQNMRIVSLVSLAPTLDTLVPCQVLDRRHRWWDTPLFSSEQVITIASMASIPEFGKTLGQRCLVLRLKLWFNVPELLRSRVIGVT